jgi:Fe-S-cluster containining protein
VGNSTMDKGPYYISENLDSLVKQRPELKKQIRDMLDHYIAEYKRCKKDVGGYNAAFNYNELLQQSINGGLKEYGKPISCQNGCSFCCHTAVDISIDEADLLVRYTHDEGISIDWDKVTRQSEMNGDRDWWLLNSEDRKCVFLNNNGKCSVYKHRPGVCRKLMVVSDSSLCDMDNNKSTKVARLAPTEAEVIACAALTAAESGLMPKMLLKVKNGTNEN